MSQSAMNQSVVNGASASDDGKDLDDTLVIEAEVQVGETVFRVTVSHLCGKCFATLEPYADLRPYQCSHIAHGLDSVHSTSVYNLHPAF